MHRQAALLYLRVGRQAVWRRRVRLEVQHRVLQEQPDLQALQHLDLPNWAVQHSVHRNRRQCVHVVHKPPNQRCLHERRPAGRSRELSDRLCVRIFQGRPRLFGL
jgi:hypothetical protein